MNNIPYKQIARYLAGECNEEEKKHIQEWSRRNPDLMQEYINIWEKVPSEPFTPQVEQALKKVNLQIDTRKQSRRKRLYRSVGYAAAAILVCVSLLGIHLWNTSTTTTINPLLTLQTGAGGTIEYTFPDGSIVWLNQSSVLHYPEGFAGNTREVFLEGEAFFDVAPNTDKPFIIHANNTQTRVVGTSFGVRALNHESEVVVTVSTGVINFSAEESSKHLELHPGEQGVCNPLQQTLKKNIHPDMNSLAWKTRKLVFIQSPLSEVAGVIQNSYHTDITVDKSVAALPITTTFEQRTLEEILQIIEMTLQIEARKTENGFLLTTKPD